MEGSDQESCQSPSWIISFGHQEWKLPGDQLHSVGYFNVLLNCTLSDFQALLESHSPRATAGVLRTNRAERIITCEAIDPR